VTQPIVNSLLQPTPLAGLPPMPLTWSSGFTLILVTFPPSLELALYGKLSAYYFRTIGSSTVSSVGVTYSVRTDQKGFALLMV